MTTVLVLTWPDGLTFTEMEAMQNQLEAEHACQVTVPKDDPRLARAVELLREFGQCDPYTGQPYDEVVEFLASLDA
jgi:hypothetical protein